MEAATGSTTNGVGPSRPMPVRSQAAATAWMIPAVASIPVLTASRPMSVATASICAATISGGTVCTPVTPTEFCTVTAVTATQPCTPQAAIARRSAATPAPPPESVPAIVITRGGVRPTVRSLTVRTVAGPAGRHHRCWNTRMTLSGEREISPEGWVRDQTEKVLSNGTTEGVQVLDRPIVLVTVRGAKSGKLRYTPVMRVEHDGRYAMIASKGGAPEHPAWYHNLVANPHVELQDGTETKEYDAREVSGAERDEWWERSVAAYPPYAEYQTKTDRLIPVFVLEPREG